MLFCGAMITSAFGRVVQLGSLGAHVEPLPSDPFAVLLPAYAAADCEAVLALAPSLLDRGCRELSCVGPQGEALHDALDDLIVQRSMTDDAALAIITTWHDDELDACEYLLRCAGAGELALLALVNNHPALRHALETFDLDA